MAIKSSLRVDPESLVRQASVVETTVASISEALQTMQRALANTNYWKGSAADLHHNDLNSRQTEIASLMNRLRAYPVDICKIASNYQTAEQGNANKAKQLPSDMLH